MSLSFMSREMTRNIFRLASGLSAIYFLLVLFPPSNFFLFNYPFLEYNEYHWWAPRWLVESIFWGGKGYGIGTPVLILSLALTVVGFIGLLIHSNNKKNSQNRPILLAAIAAAGTMLATSVVLAFLTFPDLENANTRSISSSWNIPLLILFTFTTIISLASFGGLLIAYLQQKKIALWAGILLIVGLVALSLNWFTFFPSWSLHIIAFFGIGWAVGLWHLGHVAVDRPVEHNLFPHPTLRKVMLWSGALVGLWLAVFGSVFALNARNSDALCRGSQTETQLANGGTRVEQESESYRFVYINSEELSWEGGLHNASSKKPENCALTTWKHPEWVVNPAMNYLPLAGSYWFYERFAPEPPEAVATFNIAVNDTEFDSTQEMYEDRLERRRLYNEDPEKYRFYGEDIEYSLTTLNDRPALMYENSVGSNNSYGHYEYYALIKDGKQYSVGWRVWSENADDRDHFVEEHRATLDAMTNSFSFK